MTDTRTLTVRRTRALTCLVLALAVTPLAGCRLGVQVHGDPGGIQTVSSTPAASPSPP